MVNAICKKKMSIIEKIILFLFVIPVALMGCSAVPSKTGGNFAEKSVYNSANDALYVIPGNAIYVSVNGNDSWAGTFDRPLRNIRTAALKTKPGDTVLVREGLYEDIIEIKNSGRPDAWITYRAYPGEKVIVKDNGWWSEWSVAFDVCASYIHIEGFEVTNSRRKDIKFNDSREWAFNGKGIRIGGGDSIIHHVRIFNNKVYDCAGSGIAAGNADYIHVKGNTVFRTAWQSRFHESAINFFDIKAYDSKPGFHNIIEDNICFDNDNKTPEQLDFNHEISRDWTDGNGIIIDWCLDKNTSTLIRNNICFNNGGRGIQITVSVNVTAENNTCYMNSINRVLNRYRVPRSDGEIGVSGINKIKGSPSFGRGSENIHIRNNILYAASGRPCFGTSDIQSVFFDYNLCYNGLSGGIQNNTSAAETHGVNNVLNKDPLFANLPAVIKAVPFNNGGYECFNWDSGDYTRYDFSLRKGSPAIGAGSGIPVNKSGFADPVFFYNARSTSELGALPAK